MLEGSLRANVKPSAAAQHDAAPQGIPRKASGKRKSWGQGYGDAAAGPSLPGPVPTQAPFDDAYLQSRLAVADVHEMQSLLATLHRREADVRAELAAVGGPDTEQYGEIWMIAVTRRCSILRRYRPVLTVGCLLSIADPAMKLQMELQALSERVSAWASDRGISVQRL